jgi:Rieske Fe-S protein
VTSLPQHSPESDNGIPACLGRRDFLARSGMLAVAAALAGACGDGQIGGSITDPGGNGVLTVNTTEYPALATVGNIVRVSGTSRPIALVRSSSTRIRAFSMVCPHQGTTINVLNGTSFRCPNHGANFASTGQWTGGERTRSLVEYTAVFDAAAGTVLVTI